MSRAAFVHLLGRTSILAIGMSWLVFSGCGGGSSNPKPPVSPTLQSIAVSPQATTVATGLTEQFSASGNYSDGTSKPLNSVTWATSDTTLATVSTTGLVTAVKQGTV
jgi:Bacterial Ig-like domain (group 2)